MLKTINTILEMRIITRRSKSVSIASSWVVVLLLSFFFFTMFVRGTAWVPHRGTLRVVRCSLAWCCLGYARIKDTLFVIQILKGAGAHRSFLKHI